MLSWVDSHLSYVGDISPLRSDFPEPFPAELRCPRTHLVELMQEICLHVEARWRMIWPPWLTTQSRIQRHTHKFTDTHEQTFSLFNKHHHQGKEIVKNISSYLYFVFPPLLCLFFLSYWLNALVSVHTYFGMANRARDSTPMPLLRQIRASIKRHMARFSLSDRWCSCTFRKRRAGAAAALLVKQGGQGGSGAMRCIY